MERIKLFAIAVMQMRRAQNDYFRCRDYSKKTELLKISIAREMEVDIEIQSILSDKNETLNPGTVISREENYNQQTGKLFD